MLPGQRQLGIGVQARARALPGIGIVTLIGVAVALIGHQVTPISDPVTPVTVLITPICQVIALAAGQVAFLPGPIAFVRTTIAVVPIVTGRSSYFLHEILATSTTPLQLEKIIFRPSYGKRSLLGIPR